MTRTAANFLLLLAALLWGSTFVPQQLAMAHLGPLLYTGLRFALGMIVVAPLAWREWQRLTPATQAQLSWGRVWAVGGLLTSGIVLQQIGVTQTLVSNAGFLTTLYIPFVPLLAWFLWRQRPVRGTVPLTLVTLLGSYLLTGGVTALRAGDLWIVASALFWAGHLLLLARIAQGSLAPFVVALGQYLVCTALTTAIALFAEHWTLAAIEAALPMILYGGVLSVGIAFTLQVVALRYTRPFDAAILMASEAFFAALAGHLVLGERLTASQWLGGLLIVLSVTALQGRLVKGQKG